MDQVTHWLQAAARGEPGAVDQLMPLVYDELRQLAAQRLSRERPDHTLAPTALVHEAYLKLLGPSTPGADPVLPFANRGHFFAAAGEAMRRILVDHARQKKSRKRGGDLARHDLDDLPLAWPEPREDLVALDEALTRLAQVDPQAVQVVQMHFFAGLSLLDVAEVLSISPRTAYRIWTYARAWLRRALETP